MEEEAQGKPLALRVRHPHWMVRKKAYEDIEGSLDKETPGDYMIGSESYSLGRVVSVLNGLVDEKHPNVLLQGLECVEVILRLGAASGKHFNELAWEGLEKFPLVSQQRKQILQKFLDILELCKVDSSVLANRLALPQEKSLMFVIEVIGALRMQSLRKKLVDLSKKHPKAAVKELAAEIAHEMEDTEGVG